VKKGMKKGMSFLMPLALVDRPPQNPSRFKPIRVLASLGKDGNGPRDTGFIQE